MQKHGIKDKQHEQIMPLYDSWGIVGRTNIQQLIEIDNEYIKLLNSVDSLLDPDEYTISAINRVSYFQGEKLPEITAIWIRLTHKDNPNCLNSAHISLIYAEKTKHLLGYTRFDINSDNTVIEHQAALENAIQFLKKSSPDLINYTTLTPQLNPINIGERMIFNPALSLDNVELQWINGHYETFDLHGESIIVYGLKVKMYLPQTKLWAWVIVDKTGRIITFERNISWDFIKMERQTQMWLHDKWLIAHNIIPV